VISIARYSSLFQVDSSPACTQKVIMKLYLIYLWYNDRPFISGADGRKKFHVIAHCARVPYVHDWTISWEHNAVTGYCLHQGVPHTDMYTLKISFSPFIGGGGAVARLSVSCLIISGLFSGLSFEIHRLPCNTKVYYRPYRILHGILPKTNII
jgi:hypothetical protein